MHIGVMLTRSARRKRCGFLREGCRKAVDVLCDEVTRVLTIHGLVCGRSKRCTEVTAELRSLALPLLRRRWTFLKELSAMARTVATYCIYPSMTALETAAEALKAEGFRQTDISVLYSDRCGAIPLPASSAADRPSAGAIPYAGNVLAYLAGIGALTLPDVGPMLAAGPLAGAFTGLSLSPASQSLTGALVGLGLPETEAKCYEGCLKAGGILMSVYCDDAEWAGRAKNILTRTGAEHLAAATEGEAGYPS